MANGRNGILFPSQEKLAPVLSLSLSLSLSLLCVSKRSRAYAILRIGNISIRWR
jgi:hypothetical protein